MEHLIQLGAKAIGDTDEGACTRLLQAAAKDGIRTADDLKKLVGVILPTTTALHIACEVGNELLVNTLLEDPEQASSILMEDHNGDTAIHAGIRGKKIGILKALTNKLDAAADLNASNKFGKTALQLAVESGDVHAACHLIQLGAKAIGDTDEGARPRLLQAAAKDGTADDLKKLVGVIRPTTSALHLACEVGNEGIVKALLDDLDTIVFGKDGNGNTALHVAVSCGHSKILQALAGKLGDAATRIDSPNSSGETALQLAVEKSNVDAACLLVKLGAKAIGTTSEDACTRLVLQAAEASTGATAEDLKKLVEVIRPKTTALHIACEVGNEGLVENLLEDPEQVNNILKEDHTGKTALHVAATTSREEGIPRTQPSKVIIQLVSKLELNDAAAVDKLPGGEVLEYNDQQISFVA